MCQRPCWRRWRVLWRTGGAAVLLLAGRSATVPRGLAAALLAGAVLAGAVLAVLAVLELAVL